MSLVPDRRRRDSPPCGIPLVWPVPDFYVSFPFQLLANEDDCFPFSFPLLGPPPEELFVRAKTCLKPNTNQSDGVPCAECARMSEFVARAAVIAAEDIPDVPYRLMSHRQLVMSTRHRPLRWTAWITSALIGSGS